MLLTSLVTQQSNKTWAAHIHLSCSDIMKSSQTKNGNRAKHMDCFMSCMHIMTNVHSKKLIYVHSYTAIY